MSPIFTFDAFVGVVRSIHRHPTNQKSVGDVFIHVLKQERPHVAEFIEGTLYDTTGKDSIHPKVLDVVKSQW
jgi:hypothetical protein